MSIKRREPAKRKLSPEGVVLCSCGCGRKPEPPRRSWFSEACVHDWKIANDPAYVRDLLWGRDKGICAACGCDSEAEYDKWRRARKEAGALVAWFERRERLEVARDFPGRSLHSPEVEAALWPDAVRRGRWDRILCEVLRDFEELRIMQRRDPGWFRGRSSGWDADHIVEVVNGGGQCGLENYQTLCHMCHKAKTARLKAELAERKRAEKSCMGALALGGNA